MTTTDNSEHPCKCEKCARYVAEQQTASTINDQYKWHQAGYTDGAKATWEAAAIMADQASDGSCGHGFPCPCHVELEREFRRRARGEG